MKENEMILISEEVNGIYLSYCNREYIMFHGETSRKFDKMGNPQELFDNLINIKNYEDYDNDIKLFISNLEGLRSISRTEAEKDLMALLEDLKVLFYDMTEVNDKKRIISERLQKITNPKIIDRVKKQNSDYEKSKYTDIQKSIRDKLTQRKGGDIDIARRELSKYLTIRYGAILRKNIGDVFILDGDGYIKTSHDDLILMLKNDFEDNFIHDNDLKNAIGFISDRREPIPNIVKFKNCLYDMDKIPFPK